MDFSCKELKGFEYESDATFTPFKGLNSKQLKIFEEGRSKILKDFQYKTFELMGWSFNERIEHVVSLEGENLTMIRIRRKMKDDLLIPISDTDQYFKVNEATLIHERRIMVKCTHPSFPKLRRTILTGEHLVYLMEYTDRKNELVECSHNGKAVRLDPVALKEALIWIISALNYLSDNNCLPAAILPEDFFFDENGKLMYDCFPTLRGYGDSLSGRFYDVDMLDPIWLTQEERVEDPFLKLSWGIGCLTHMLIFGETPFYSENTNEIYENTIENPIEIGEPTEVNSKFPSSLKDFLDRTITRDISKRLDLEGIMSHEYFAGVDWEKVGTEIESQNKIDEEERIDYIRSAVDIEKKIFVTLKNQEIAVFRWCM